MKNFRNVLTTKRNNLGLFFQLVVFSLFGIMILFSGQTLAQANCTPNTTVSEGDLAPGGIVSFGVSSGAGSVTADHVNAGTGLQSLTVLGTPVNAVVSVPAYAPGTYSPVTVTFTVTDPNQPVDFTLRAASTFHAANIRVRCGGSMPTPTPTPTPMGTPTPTPTPMGTPTPTATPTPTPGGLTSFSGRATSINATINGVNNIGNDTGNLPSRGGFITRSLPSSSMFAGSLITGSLDATAQAAFDQSRSQAIVENLVLTLNGDLITADLIPSSSQCTCTAANTPPVCAGGVMIANLRSNGVVIPIIDQAVNQRVNLSGSGYLIYNEQFRTASGNGASIAVNGVHIIVPGMADVIFSTAQSGIFCGSNVSPEENKDQ